MLYNTGKSKGWVFGKNISKQKTSEVSKLRRLVRHCDPPWRRSNLLINNRPVPICQIASYPCRGVAMTGITTSQTSQPVRLFLPL